jgi:hypothetical protein
VTGKRPRQGSPFCPFSRRSKYDKTFLQTGVNIQKGEESVNTKPAINVIPSETVKKLNQTKIYPGPNEGGPFGKL